MSGEKSSQTYKINLVCIEEGTSVLGGLKDAFSHLIKSCYQPTKGVLAKFYIIKPVARVSLNALYDRKAFSNRNNDQRDPSYKNKMERKYYKKQQKERYAVLINNASKFYDIVDFFINFA